METPKSMTKHCPYSCFAYPEFAAWLCSWSTNMTLSRYTLWVSDKPNCWWSRGKFLGDIQSRVFRKMWWNAWRWLFQKKWCPTSEQEKYGNVWENYRVYGCKLDCWVHVFPDKTTRSLCAHTSSYDAGSCKTCRYVLGWSLNSHEFTASEWFWLTMSTPIKYNDRTYP